MINNLEYCPGLGMSDHLCVVKTYPSIDPIVAPPPDINYIYKCHFHNRERDVITLALSRLHRMIGSACNTCITVSRE